MNTRAPRTSKEALIAEMLGDLEQLLARIENLPSLIASAEGEISRSFDKPLERVAGLADQLAELHSKMIELVKVTPRLLEAAELRMQESTDKIVSSLDAAGLRVESSQRELLGLIAAHSESSQALATERAELEGLRSEIATFQKLGLWDRIFYKPGRGR